MVEGDFASAQKIRKTFTEPKETGSLQRLQTYSEDVRQAVRDNVEYIDSTLKPEQKFRSDIMSIPKVKAAISMTARRLDLDEAFVRKQTENFLSEFFRSRDEGARTGQGVQDAQIVVRLLEDSGLFNPLSDNFLASLTLFFIRPSYPVYGMLTPLNNLPAFFPDIPLCFNIFFMTVF